MNKEILIIGAGKIGRGFIAHLFYRSGYKIWFMDANEEVVASLAREKGYRIDIAKADTDVTHTIGIENAYTLKERAEVSDLLGRVDLIASSVGATHIASVAAYIKGILGATGREKVLNWLICENAYRPADTIRAVLMKDAAPRFRDFVNNKLGLVETQVLRTGMPANGQVLAEEPLALRMQDWWTLPFDRDAFIGDAPDVEGLVGKTGFANELVRKLYSFNGTNGPIAYVGSANGFDILHEAALAFPAYFKEIQEEASYGLVREFGFDEKEQAAFMALALKKYTDPAINDRIERNAADSMRKLGREERLIGPAMLCLKHGKVPHAYARAIAAAYAYDGSSDKGTLEVLETVRKEGISKAIKKISSLDETCPLHQMIVQAYNAKSFIF